MSFWGIFCAQVGGCREREERKKVRKICVNMQSKIQGVREKGEREQCRQCACIWFFITRCLSRTFLRICRLSFFIHLPSSHFVFFTSFSTRSFPVHFASQIRKPPSSSLFAQCSAPSFRHVPHFPSPLPSSLPLFRPASIHPFISPCKKSDSVFFRRESVYLQL